MYARKVRSTKPSFCTREDHNNFYFARNYKNSGLVAAFCNGFSSGVTSAWTAALLSYSDFKKSSQKCFVSLGTIASTNFFDDSVGGSCDCGQVFITDFGPIRRIVVDEIGFRFASMDSLDSVSDNNSSTLSRLVHSRKFSC